MYASWQELLDQVRKGIRIRTHSQEVCPGEVFVALPGIKVNGVQFIPQALQRGAAYVVSSKKLDGLENEDCRIVYHPDPNLALGELAKAYYKLDQYDFSLLGLTGTNGKTTVSYILEYLLQRAGFKVGVVGTINYRWPGFQQDANLTTPGCIELYEILSQMGEQGIDVVCMEVSSHALAQNRVAGLEFALALFMNLTQDHLDYHEDMERYFQAKSKLFFPSCSPSPYPVINLDDIYGQRLANSLGSGLGFSLKGYEQTDIPCLQGKILSATQKGLHLRMSFEESYWELKSPLIGGHNASNLLAAQAVGLRMGLDSNDLLVLKDFSKVPGRLERVKNELGLNIFIDYAHTPDALENILAAVRRFPFQNLIVVFGCGGERDRKKRPLMGQAVAKYADEAILTSDNPRNEDPQKIINEVMVGLQGIKVICEKDRRQAIRLAISRLGIDDVLIIAGKGHENYQQLGDKKFPFSDFDVVKEFINASKQNNNIGFYI